MINIGIIGVGYWGPNLLRNFVEIPTCVVQHCADLDKSRLAKVRQNYPFVKTTQDYRELLENPKIDGIVIATPAATHYQFVKESLLHDKHVFVEKPLALSVTEGEELAELVEQTGKALLVGHVFEYNPAVRKLKEYITNGELGDIYYIYCARLNLGQVRRDVNALWNFAPHDVSILIYLLDSVPTKVSASGACFLQPDVEDVVFMNLWFSNNVMANIHLSWLDPNKVRKVTVVGSQKMALYDDVDSEAPIKLYDRGVLNQKDYVSFGEYQFKLRFGDVHIPYIERKEPLKIECEHFLEAIQGKVKPLTDVHDGLRVVRVLEAAQRSLKNGTTVEKVNEHHV